MISNNSNEGFNVGDKVKVIERTFDGQEFEWDGIVTEANKVFIETKHSRNSITHPQWHSYMRAYMDTYTKHYGLQNIKKV